MKNGNKLCLYTKDINKSLEEALTLLGIGRVYDLLGEKPKALDYYNQALSISQAINNRELEATVLNNIGLVYYSLGEKQKALNYYNQALTILGIVGDREKQAKTFSIISLIEYDKQNYDAALKNINKAIEIFEQIRNKILDNDLKASFFSTVEDYYKFKTEILMELHQLNPNQGYDVLAFETSEQGKARSLLELLTEANIDIRQGIALELVTAEKRLQNRLDAVEKRRISLCSKDCTPRQLNQLETERSELLEQYKQLKTKIRANSPKYAELTQPEPIKLQQLQKLLDEDTVLWQYSLWQEASYVWVITKDTFSTHELASREEIEPIAREYHKLLQYESRTNKLNSAATKLSQLITPPIVESQQKSRIVIVSDGVLQYIPYSEKPELSGIVLSLFDKQGKPQNGFLRLHEVFNLNLPVDLVVLSACQTGLGKEIKGEG